MEDYNLYLNVLEFTKHRFGKTFDPIDKREFKEQYKVSGYISIVFDKIKILLLNDKGKYTSLGADTKKLAKEKLKEIKFSEIIIIMSIDLRGASAPSNLESIRKFREDEAFANTWIQVRPKNNFLVVIPKSKWVPKHERILDQVKLKKDISLWNQVLSNPRIDEYDPPIMWEGAKAGELVKVYRPSGSIGEQIIYRLVK